VYRPDPARADAYDSLYADYVRLHDHFGQESDLMHRLRRLRNGPSDAGHGGRGDR
jgi:L-ribulokinase